MARYNIYAVAYGIDPKTNTVEPQFIGLKFKTWDECKPYVLGASGAKYKGFLTEEEADKWLEQYTNTVNGQESTSVSKPASKPWQEKADKIYQSKIHPVDEEFISTCKGIGLSIVDTEHLLKRIFIDIVKYLDDNGCINELPFN